MRAFKFASAAPASLAHGRRTHRRKRYPGPFPSHPCRLAASAAASARLRSRQIAVLPRCLRQSGRLFAFEFIREPKALPGCARLCCDSCPGCVARSGRLNGKFAPWGMELYLSLFSRVPRHPDPSGGSTAARRRRVEYPAGRRRGSLRPHTSRRIGAGTWVLSRLLCCSASRARVGARADTKSKGGRALGDRPWGRKDLRLHGVDDKGRGISPQHPTSGRGVIL